MFSVTFFLQKVHCSLITEAWKRMWQRGFSKNSMFNIFDFIENKRTSLKLLILCVIFFKECKIKHVNIANYHYWLQIRGYKGFIYYRLRLEAIRISTSACMRDENNRWILEIDLLKVKFYYAKLMWETFILKFGERKKEIA